MYWIITIVLVLVAYKIGWWNGEYNGYWSAVGDLTPKDHFLRN